MEFTGRISKVLPLRSGTSQRTGNEWQSQPFVFEFFEHETDRYADSVVLETFDTNIIPHIKEGAQVRCGFGHKARPIQKDGKEIVINEVRLYKFEPVSGANKAAGGANDNGVAHNGDPAVTGPQNQPNAAQEGANSDDLPF